MDDYDRLKQSHVSVGVFMITCKDEAELKREVVCAAMNLMPRNEVFEFGHYVVDLEEHVITCVQNKNQFDELILDISFLAPGSCIIVTSRDQHLLKVVAGGSNFYLHEVTILGCNDSQKLFNLHAFGIAKAPKNFEVLAHDVSAACGGLPLALKVVGSSLFDKRSNEDQECIWPEVVDALKGNLDVMEPQFTSRTREVDVFGYCLHILRLEEANGFGDLEKL